MYQGSPRILLCIQDVISGVKDYVYIEGSIN